MFKTHHITCIVWMSIGLLAISLQSVQSGPVDENEVAKVRECKTFCKSCGCVGFYCGEECICECNEEKNDDTECIASIQKNAKQRKTPFEILIQGPSGNRFLMNALQFDQNQQQCSNGDLGRSKRSTVVIYKPAAENTLDPNGFCTKPLEKDEDRRKQMFRGKRAVDGGSWFTDFSNTLVKPAPVKGKSVEIEDVEDQEEEPVKAPSAEAGDRSNFLPKIRGKIRDAFNIGENSGIVKGIRKTVKKIEDKALKAVELDKTAKKIRGAISTLGKKAEDILLPSAEEIDVEEKPTAGRKILNKLRGRIFRSFGDDNDATIS